jgi:RimJ/RimL family protein N-acetyltransferase
MTHVVTERLTLTTLTREQARAIVSGDREGRSWAPDYPTEGDVLVASVVLEAGDAYDEDAPLGPMVMTITGTGLVVGGVGYLHAPEDDGSVEIGYGIAESVRGQGLVTEAVEALVALARAQGASSVVALTTPGNEASQRVLGRTGFVRDGEVDTGESGVMWRWRRR